MDIFQKLFNRHMIEEEKTNWKDLKDTLKNNDKPEGMVGSAIDTIKTVLDMRKNKLKTNSKGL